MSNQWLRLWHDMPNDPKWRTIARISGQSISMVQAIWLHILVSASESKERGIYSISEESIASALNESDEAIAAIVSAMQQRVLSGNKVINWENRQPNRDEGGSVFNYIYYVGTEDSDVVKIGISKNPWARVKDMQTGSPVKYRVLATIKTQDRSEVAIHQFFKQSRTSGEWFKRSNALNTLIDQINSKAITTSQEAQEFLSTLPSVDFIPTVVATYTTKDKEEIREDKKERKDKEVFVLPDWVDQKVWDGFMEVRKEKKAADTVRAKNSIINELDRFRQSGHDPNQIIEKSVRNSWKDVFEPKGNNHANTSTNTAKGSKSDRARAAIIESATELGYANRPPAGEAGA